MAAQEIDKTIQASVSALGAYLGSDRGGIALFSEDGRSLAFPGTDTSPRERSPALFETDLAQALPWYVGEVREGRPLISRALPEGAPGRGRRRASLRLAIGLKSPVRGAVEGRGGGRRWLGVDYLTACHDWSPESLVADGAARERLCQGALPAGGRKPGSERLAELNRSVLESVSGEIVVLDRDGRIVAVNEAWTRSARREAIPQERAPVGSDYVVRDRAGRGRGHRGAPGAGRCCEPPRRPRGRAAGVPDDLPVPDPAIVSATIS